MSHRVVVSSIMLNEPEDFIVRWAKSAEEADARVLVDTGSTNAAVECARDHGVTVHSIRVRPWRFDVARNAALSLLPENVDTVVTLDVDEVLVPGWRQALDAAGPAGRYSYRYIWSWRADGTPDVTFRADRTHSRHGWIWRHPVHESLYWVGGTTGTGITVPGGFTIEHHPDDTKTRAEYLPLLALAVSENPGDARMAHYYARELFFHNDWTAARVQFTRHLKLAGANWPAERAASYRYLAQMDVDPERWLLFAAAEDPGRRETWVALAQMYVLSSAPERLKLMMAAGAAARALTLRIPTDDYMTSAEVWDDEQMLAIIAAAGETME